MEGIKRAWWISPDGETILSGSDHGGILDKAGLDWRKKPGDNWVKLGVESGMPYFHQDHISQTTLNIAQDLFRNHPWIDSNLVEVWTNRFNIDVPVNFFLNCNVSDLYKFARRGMEAGRATRLALLLIKEATDA